MDQLGLQRNYTVFVSDDEIIVTPAEGGVQDGVRDKEYDQFMADVWVGIVLTLMVLSCVCCMCSFLLYHKFQQWKITAVDGQERPHTIESAYNEVADQLDLESLPTYTIVSGLPTYDEALEQMRSSGRDRRRSSLLKMAEANNQQNGSVKLSVAEFLQIYKSQRIIQND